MTEEEKNKKGTISSMIVFLALLLFVFKLLDLLKKKVIPILSSPAYLK